MNTLTEPYWHRFDNQKCVGVARTSASSVTIVDIACSLMVHLRLL
ncbi:MAG: hypothetical protein ACYT04_54320 [Nostoc sp.]